MLDDREKAVLQPKEQLWLERLNSRAWTLDELENLYENARTKGFQTLATVIHERLWRAFPRRARSRFGSKDEWARELLQQVFDETAAELDLTGNRVGNGVKTGGLQFSGKKYVNVYISYRNERGQGAALGLHQDVPGVEKKVEIVEYEVGRNQRRGQRFEPYTQFSALAEKYKDLLRTLVR